MAKFNTNTTLTTLLLAAGIAAAIGYAAHGLQAGRAETHAPAGLIAAAAQDGASALRPRWAASATGRVEPKAGETRIGAQVAGKVEEILVKTNDRVAAGDLLIRLDGEDAMRRRDAAIAEAQVRQLERDEEGAKGLAQERRDAEDALADAERALFRARFAFDGAAAKARAGDGSAETVSAARAAIRAAEEHVAANRAALEDVSAKDEMPLPSRLESSLTQARSDVSLAESAIERTRIRAPFDGAVLNVFAREGEIAAPSVEAPLLLAGDLSTLRVRAEVEERDVTKVRVGQGVVVRADAFPDREFEGKVTSVAAALGSPRIASRGPRRPNDVEVLEVLAELDGAPPLLTGMRVDVFFKLEAATQSSAN